MTKFLYQLISFTMKLNVIKKQKGTKNITDF